MAGLERAIEERAKLDKLYEDLRSAGKHSKETLKIIRDDIEAGITLEHARHYESITDYERVKILSKCFRKRVPDEIIEELENVPAKNADAIVEALIKVMDEKDNSHIEKIEEDLGSIKSMIIAIQIRIDALCEAEEPKQEETKDAAPKEEPVPINDTGSEVVSDYVSQGNVMEETKNSGKGLSFLATAFMKKSKRLLMKHITEGHMTDADKKLIFEAYADGISENAMVKILSYGPIDHSVLKSAIEAARITGQFEKR